jgi:hypothetical protein
MTDLLKRLSVWATSMDSTFRSAEQFESSIVERVRHLAVAASILNNSSRLHDAIYVKYPFSTKPQRHQTTPISTC